MAVSRLRRLQMPLPSERQAPSTCNMPTGQVVEKPEPGIQQEGDGQARDSESTEDKGGDVRELVRGCCNQLIIDSRLRRKESVAKGSLESGVG